VAHPCEHEAAAWVAGEIERLRALSYGCLVRLEGRPEHRALEASDKTPLVLESQVLWDDRERRNLRIMVDVWDPSRRLTTRSVARDDFVRAPDGSFVGE
jgi:hypothetical protein